MSVITYHEVSNEKKDLFDRLTAEGVIHPGQIYIPALHEYRKFDAVFDYTKCDEKTLAELDARTAEHKKMYREDLAKNSSLTEEERAYRYAEYLKHDNHLLPVSRSKFGGVAWDLNYRVDDLPSFAIGRRYPNEVFEYLQATEGELDCNVKFKKDKDIENLMVKDRGSVADGQNEDMPVELDMSEIDKKFKDRVNGKVTGKGSR